MTQAAEEMLTKDDKNEIATAVISETGFTKEEAEKLAKEADERNKKQSQSKEGKEPSI